MMVYGEQIIPLPPPGAPTTGLDAARGLFTQGPGGDGARTGLSVWLCPWFSRASTEGAVSLGQGGGCRREAQCPSKSCKSEQQRPPEKEQLPAPGHSGQIAGLGARGWGVGVPTVGRTVLAPHRGSLSCTGSGRRTRHTEKGVSLVLGVHTCFCDTGLPLKSHMQCVSLAGRREAGVAVSPACSMGGVPGTGALGVPVSAFADLALASAERTAQAVGCGTRVLLVARACGLRVRPPRMQGGPREEPVHWSQRRARVCACECLRVHAYGYACECVCACGVYIQVYAVCVCVHAYCTHQCVRSCMCMCVVSVGVHVHICVDMHMCVICASCEYVHMDVWFVCECVGACVWVCVWMCVYMHMSVACGECECTCTRRKCTAHHVTQHSAGACPWSSLVKTKSQQGPRVSGPAPSPRVKHCFPSSWGWASSSHLGQGLKPGSGRGGAGTRNLSLRLVCYSCVFPRATVHSTGNQSPHSALGLCPSRQSLHAPQAAPPRTALGSLENWVPKSGLS